ncbi:hypothetical protein [Amphritea pacifica]|uniref:hypothetical protein n=1 Tax=Amphritea pacifica TaxID=2811233 RepID=UPI0019664AFF|nr:hypothetical protein [Amphritea pacifica]MBN1008917.1 hypothetical protein [Amphritea pacifica]
MRDKIMLTTFYYIDLYNKQQQNQPETEREYFLRMAREMEQARTLEKRQARKANIKAIFVAALNLFKAKPVQGTDSVFGH